MEEELPEIRLMRGIIYLIISDFFKTVGAQQDLSSKLIFSTTGETARHFSFLCDMADFDPAWIRRRVRYALRAKVKWRSMQCVGERVLGMASLSQYIYEQTRRNNTINTDVTWRLW